jgi:hypothetical protein
MLKAAENALRELRRPEDVAKARGMAVRDVLPWKEAVAESAADEATPEAEETVGAEA